MPVLYALSGPDLGRTFDVEDGALIGRVPECEVQLHDVSVSRRHARLERRGEAWALVDQGSRNGITREGRRARELELEDGALFELGKVEFRFREEAPAASAPPAAHKPRSMRKPERAVAPKPKPEPEPELHFDSDFDDEPEAPDSGGIVLEDEELLDAPPAPRPATPAPSRPAPLRGAPPRAAPPPSAPARTAPPSGGRAHGGVEVRDAGRPVLQYSKTVERRGFFQADLSQYPLWVRLLAGLLVAAVFVLIFYVAYRSSGALKARAVGAPDAGQGFEEEL